jgi:chromosome segregation ATPase
MRWWKDPRSTAEMAERLARSHVDKQELECRIAELLDENNVLRIRCSVAATELQDERHRLKEEILSLHSEIDEAKQRVQETSGAGRREAESAARERLIKDEFERRIEAVRLEFNREKQRWAKQIEDMKQKMAGCICGDIRIEHNVDQSGPSASSGLPKRWVIRNSR